MNGFNFVEDEAVVTNGGGNTSYAEVGINTGNITKLVYNPNGGSGGAPTDCIDVTFNTKGKDFTHRLYDANKVYDKDGNEVAASDPAYNGLVVEGRTAIGAYMKQLLKALGVTDAAIKASLAVPPTSFKDWAIIMTGLVPANYTDLPVDCFLEYQWKIGKNREGKPYSMTFLQLPQKVKGGRLFCPAVAVTGEWEQRPRMVSVTDDAGVVSTEENGAIWVDSQIPTNIHPMVRNANFMESNKFIQQKLNTESSVVTPPSATSGGAGWD